MHIALLAPMPPERNGIAAYADTFRCALEADGVRVSLPLRDVPGVISEPSLRQTLESVDWLSFDLVHGELGGGRAREFLALDWLSMHHPGLPLTATVHDPDRILWKPARMPGWLQRGPRWANQAAVLLMNPLTLSRERELASRLSQVITLTRTGTDGLRRSMRLSGDRVRHIPHGTHPLPAEPLPPLPPAGPLRLLYFGFMYRGKGIEDLIDAMALLREGHDDLGTRLELTLAGGTTPDLAFGAQEGYLDSLRQRLSSAGLEDVPMQWRLDVPDAEIASLIQTHHVMVLPYRESAKLARLGRMRGTSGAFAWAAACGRSVVTSNARAFPEEVSFGNGAVFPQGNANALKEELEHLLDHPECIQERSERAAQVGLERRWPKIASEFHAMFNEQCARKRPS
jgi:polysaccharide biosynthesis protein PslF